MNHNQKKMTASLLGYLNTLVSVAMAFFLVLNTASTQGWERIYGDNKREQSWSVVEVEDNGFLVAGFGEALGGDGDLDAYLYRVDIEGNVLWDRFYDEGNNAFIRAIVKTADDHYLLAGSIQAEAGAPENAYLIKVNGQGEPIWSRQYTDTLFERLNDIDLLPDGGFIAVGQQAETLGTESDVLVMRFEEDGQLAWEVTLGTEKTDEGNGIVALEDGGSALVSNSKNDQGIGNDILVHRLNVDGSVDWERRIANAFLEEGSDILQTQDGGFAIAGLINNNTDLYILKFSAEGDYRWAEAIGSPGIEEGGNALTEMANGDLVAAGFIVDDGPTLNSDVFLTRMTAEGEVLWEKRIGNQSLLYDAREVINVSDGGILITGYTGLIQPIANNSFLIKTDGNGNLISNVIHGSVFATEAGICDFSGSERLLDNWMVRAKKDGQIIFSNTDRDGNYSIGVDTGTYQIDLLPANSYWEPCLKGGLEVSMTSFYDSSRVDLGASAKVDCPWLEVEISAPTLAICSEVVYTIDYRNAGASDAEETSIEVTLDEELSLLKADLPHTLDQDGNIKFQLGLLEAGASGRFTFTAQMACEGITIGQAALVRARIQPDSFCLIPDSQWDGADLEVIGACEGDSVVFTLRNVGVEITDEPVQSVIVQDIIILNEDSLLLAPGEEIEFRFPATGDTYRFIIEESEGHPFSDYASAAVEGCSQDGVFSVGIYTMFPEDDQEPTVAINVQEVSGSVLPVEMRGYPKGYKEEVIAAETDLTYKVLFTLESTDTIGRLIIRDTLPTHLDVTSVKPGPSNLPYQLEVFSSGILKFTFDDLRQLLQDSTGQVIFKLGHVSYTVSQQPDIEYGTIIDNYAWLYFDYQEPVQTNIVRRRVEEFPGFIDIVNDVFDTPRSQNRLTLYPNPFKEMVTFELEGGNVETNLLFSIYDLSGKRILQRQVSGPRFQLHRMDLPANGIYIYQLQIAEGQQLINSGKLVLAQ